MICTTTLPVSCLCRNWPGFSSDLFRRDAVQGTAFLVVCSGLNLTMPHCMSLLAYPGG